MRPSVVLGWAAVVIAVICTVGCHLSPLADARGRFLERGTPGGSYPLAGGHGPALDPWGFVARQCTSYAAWYLNDHGVPFGLLTRGPGGEGLFTSADSWDDAADAAGFPVLPTPAVGSIAQWDAGERSPAAPAGADAAHGTLTVAGSYGHVAVVRSVFPDGSVLIGEYDGGDSSFHQRITRAPRYLYIGVPTTTARTSVAAAAAQHGG